MARIVLASGSRRRQELLTRIGIRDFAVRVPQVEEWYPQGLTPPEIVSYISREKSQAVPSEEDEIVITADTMVFLDQQRLGKPKDEADALRMLTDLAGRRHTVCTGVFLLFGLWFLFWPISGAASPWTWPGPTACRARGPCWWSASTGIFST